VLRVAQPNLSVAIKQLESEWGVSLFERAGSGSHSYFAPSAACSMSLATILGCDIKMA
jgi:DNA-binding transcriptional LysR family regulator